MRIPANPKPAVDATSTLVRSRLTLADVARAAGVSRTTVSNAFNRPGELSQALRAQVLSKARELGYFGPDMVARALRRRDLHEVGVVFHHDLGYALSDPSSLEFLRGVAHELDARQLALQLIPKMGRKLELETAFQTTADVLIVHAEIGPELAPQVSSARKPVVVVDSMVAGVPSVRTNDRVGAALAMDHVLDARPDVVIVLCFLVTDEERSRVLSVRRPPRSAFVGSERIAGYAQSARARGFPLEQIVWIEVDDQWPETAGQRIDHLRQRFAAGTRIGIVGMSDRLALSARETVRKWRGVKLVSVVGFDDIPAAASAGLSTIYQDHFLKGRRCVEVALDGAKASVMPVKLVVRDT